MSLQYQLINGNSAEELKKFPDNHFDSVVTDPPYGINFLGKDWDTNTGEEEVYRQCLRVLKPGGHLLAFSAARTYHHLAMAVERSGFEIRDQIMWVYGSGFPKSQDIGRQIDKAAGKKDPNYAGTRARGSDDKVSINIWDENETAGRQCGKCGKHVYLKKDCVDNACGLDYQPQEDAAKQWSGWGTNLKPAHEPIVMAQKPFKDAIYKNVQKWGTGAINVDGCRVPLGEGDPTPEEWKKGWDRTAGGAGEYSKIAGEVEHGTAAGGKNISDYAKDGRFPANFIHDGSDEVVALFPDNCGNAAKAKRTKDSVTGTGASLTRAKKAGEDNGFYDGLGSAARFFYQAKVSKSERNVGCEDIEPKFKEAANFRPNHMEKALNGEDGNPFGRYQPTNNNHPTVKPVALMKYLVTLVTPPGGKVLDPFNGSGSTGMACAELGMDYTGIELDPNYIAISEKRIEAWYAKTHPQTPNPFGNDLFQEEEEK